VHPCTPMTSSCSFCQMPMTSRWLAACSPSFRRHLASYATWLSVKWHRLGALHLLGGIWPLMQHGVSFLVVDFPVTYLGILLSTSKSGVDDTTYAPQSSAACVSKRRRPSIICSCNAPSQGKFGSKFYVAAVGCPWYLGQTIV
jgi:hypothetical protein